MILKFPKIFKGKESDSELLEQDFIEVDSADNNADQSDELVTDGRVSIDFTSASPADGGLIVGFFVSNGYRQKVKFNKLPLVLLDSEKRVLAEQIFDGETIGKVAGGSTKACVVRFDRKNVYTKDVPPGSQIHFDVRPRRRLSPQSGQSVKILFQALPEKIPAEQKKELEQILAKLPPMKRGEVNFAPLWAKFTPQMGLLATVIIRNSTNKPISVEQIPLAIYDAKQKELARGIFDVKNISIQPFKAILWTFNFKPVTQGQEIDLSSWHIDVLSR